MKLTFLGTATGLRTAVVAVALIGVATGEAEAQVDGGLPKLSRLPASTRDMALGNAHVMNAGQSDALFVHPALLTESTGFVLDVQRWGGNASLASVSAATGWFGGDVGVGAGVRTLQYTAPNTGEDVAPPGEDYLFDVGATPVSERVATVGLARAFFGVGVGTAFDLIEERVGGVASTVLNVDVGLARPVGPVLVGVTAQGWGYAPIGDRGDIWPERVVVGAGSYGRQFGPLDVGWAASAILTSDDVAFGGGLEVGYWPVRGRTFVARVGARQVPDGSDAMPLTLGFAYWGDALVLEWAFQPVSGAPQAGTHRFSIGWR